MRLQINIQKWLSVNERSLRLGGILFSGLIKLNYYMKGIKIGTGLNYHGSEFLDIRQGEYVLSDLKNFVPGDFPAGFEVFISEMGAWYTFYPNQETPDPGLGYFKVRTNGDEFEQLKAEVAELKKKIVVENYTDLIRTQAIQGTIASVASPSEKAGVYQLLGEDPGVIDDWKLIGSEGVVSDVEKLMSKTFPLSMTVTSTPSAGNHETGEIVFVDISNITVTQNGEDVSEKCSFYYGPDLKKFTPPLFGLKVSSNFSVKAEKGTGSVSKTLYNFYQPSYYGTYSLETWTGLDGEGKIAAIKSLGKTLRAKSNLTQTVNTGAYGEKTYIYTYPASYGPLKSILDQNGFDIIADFTREMLQVKTGVDFYVYSRTSMNPINQPITFTV